MAIIIDKLEEAVEETVGTDGSKMVTIYSKDGLRVLHYFEHTVPQYSKGISAAIAMEDELKIKHPKEWAAVSEYIGPSAGGLKDRWAPELGIIDADALCAADKKVKTRDGRLVSVYSPRVAAVMKYIMKTTPRVTISKKSANILEAGLARKYPGLF